MFICTFVFICFVVWSFFLTVVGRYSEALAMAWRTFTIAGEEPFTDCVSHPLEDIVCALLDLPREDLFPLVGHWVTLLMSHDEDGEFDMRAYVEYTIEDHMKREERNELFAFLRQELGVDWV